MRIAELAEMAQGLRDVADKRAEKYWKLQDEQCGVLYYRFLYELVSVEKPEWILETGTRSGHSAAQMAGANTSGKVITIDIDPVSKEKIAVLGFPNVIPIIGDATVSATVDQVKALTGRIDLLFLDSEHRYDIVSKEYQAYLPLVKPGGIILFDDIRLNPEMQRFWSSVSDPKVELAFLHTSCGASFGAAIKK